MQSIYEHNKQVSCLWAFVTEQYRVRCNEYDIVLFTPSYSLSFDD